MTQPMSEVEKAYRERYPNKSPLPDKNTRYTITDKDGVDIDGGFMAFNEDYKFDNHTIKLSNTPESIILIEMMEKAGFKEFEVEGACYNLKDYKDNQSIFNKTAKKTGGKSKPSVVVSGSNLDGKTVLEAVGSHKKNDADKPKYERISPEFNAMLAKIMTENPHVRLELIPEESILALGEVFTHGAKKYGENNWRECSLFSRYIGANIRHFEAYRRGEFKDEDSKFHHLWHCLTNIAILIGLHAQKDKENEKDNNQTE